MNANLKHILTDGLILFTVSTVLVVLADKGFSQLKEKGVKDSAIVNAIHSGNPEAVNGVLAKTPKCVEERDPHGRSPLIIAAYTNEGDPKSRSATDTARAAMVPELISAGADVDHADSDQWTPLLWAAWSGLPKTCEALVTKGAKVTSTDVRGNTALMLAARRGNAEIVKLLLDHGADRAATNRAGKSALDLARIGSGEHAVNEDAFQRIIEALGSSPVDKPGR